MRQVTGVVADNTVLLASTPYGYFRYDPSSKDIETKTRSSGLSESNLVWLSKDPASQKKLLVYENANMDLMDGDQLRNIPDLLLSTAQGIKRINHLLWVGSDVFLSTDLGIVVLNSLRFEIKDTYRPSVAGGNSSVFMTAQVEDQLYAATGTGLKRAPFQAALLPDLSNWSTEKYSTGAPFFCQEVLGWGSFLVARNQDSIFVKRNGSWSLLYAFPAAVTGINRSGDFLCVSAAAQGRGVVYIVDARGNLIQTLASPSLQSPSGCLVDGSVRWVGDRVNGLIRIDANGETRIVPDAPYGIAFGRGYYAGGLLMAAAGRLTSSGQTFSNSNGFYVLDENGWKSYNRHTVTALAAVQDVTTVVASPGGSTLIAGAYGSGLIEKTGDKFSLLAQSTPIAAATNNPLSYRVTGLALDQDNNLWVANHGARENLLVRKKDGSWKKFTIPFVHQDNAVGDIVVDRINRKWIISPQGNGLFCFDDNGTLEQTNDDRWRFFRQGKSNGNLPSNQVLSVAVDRNDFVWVGTNRGIAIVQCGDDLFNAASCDATLPVVQQGSFAGLLLTDESVNDIKVDGADRKWIATNNGVWLLSADGQKINSRFTVKNSSLLSNTVYTIVIDDKTGEVFFFTANGICSFRSTATQPVEEKQSLLLFPNPVPPGYTGSIAIRAVPENAWVRITELDGRLVFQTRSLGGQAIWNGKNYKGERMSSGVYLVLVSDAVNSMQQSARLFFLK